VFRSIHATQRSIPNRGFRIADQIQRDVAELIRELKDPRIGMVTIHAVEVTADYAHAKVFFSLLWRPAGMRDGLERGGRATCATACSSGCRSTTVPTLHFVFDRTTERAAELNLLINQANATRAKED